MKITLTSAMCAALLLTAAPAYATKTFNFSNVTFSTLATSGGTSAGTLTGSFTTTNDLTSITAYTIVASQSGSYNGFTFSNTNSSVTAATLPSQYFQINSTNSSAILRIYFTSALTDSGTSISTVSSFETESGLTRYPTGRIVAATTAVPEPATWAMMLIGFALVGGMARYRRKITRVTFA